MELEFEGLLPLVLADVASGYDDVYRPTSRDLEPLVPHAISPESLMVISLGVEPARNVTEVFELVWRGRLDVAKSSLRPLGEANLDPEVAHVLNEVNHGSPKPG